MRAARNEGRPQMVLPDDERYNGLSRLDKPPTACQATTFLRLSVWMEIGKRLARKLSLRGDRL